MTGIRSRDYDETEARLANDPIVLAMAVGLRETPRTELAHDGENGGPRFEFMGAANDEYRTRLAAAGRTDDQPRHLGAVAHALLLVLDEEPVAINLQTADGEILGHVRLQRHEVLGATMTNGAGVRFRVLDVPVPDPSMVELEAKYGAMLREKGLPADFDSYVATVERV